MKQNRFFSDEIVYICADIKQLPDTIQVTLNMAKHLHNSAHHTEEKNSRYWHNTFGAKVNLNLSMSNFPALHDLYNISFKVLNTIYNVMGLKLNPLLKQ
jgi:hypothetical protein